MITASSAPLAFYPAASGSLHPSSQPVVTLQHLNGHSHGEHGMMSNASSASIRDRYMSRLPHPYVYAPWQLQQQGTPDLDG